jgi:hypothetical protein
MPPAFNLSQDQTLQLKTWRSILVYGTKLFAETAPRTFLGVRFAVSAGLSLT